MPRYLLDSDVIIWCLRGERGMLDLAEGLRREGELACSVASVFEVEAGKRAGEEEMVEAFFGGLRKYDVDEEVARLGGEWQREFRWRGVTLDDMDVLIGATAAVNGLVVVTLNPRHYPMEGVEVYGR